MSLDHVKVHYVDTVDDAYAFKQWLDSRESVALDTETEGLDVSFKDQVRIIQIADADTAWVLPVEAPLSWGGLAVEALGGYTGRVIMHHLKFDMNALRTTFGDGRVGATWRRVDDTMLQSRVLDPTRSASLKNLCARHVDSRFRGAAYELAQAMKEGGHTWATVPVDFVPYWFYGGLDAIGTFRLDEVQGATVDATSPEAYQLELASSLVCGSMERHGALIDLDFASEKRTALQRYVDQLQDWCVDNYGVRPGQNASIIAKLETFGYEFTKETQSGAKALDKEVLEDVDHPLARAVLTRRRAQKIVSTYLRHFVNDCDVDGRIHPRINTCEARTTRMSMDNPNLQNLPRRSNSNAFAEVVRGCIVPDEGNILLMCDFDQLEWRLFAAVSQDPALAAAFAADDFFTEMCRRVFNDPSITKKDPRRQVVKNAMYARIYGAGPEKFAWTAGITVHEAKQFNALLDHGYPAIRALQRSVDRAGRQRFDDEGIGYVYSPLTHRRFMIEDDGFYKLVNYLFQGTAAEVLKMKLVELANAGLREYLVVPVHDEVILEVPREDLDDVAHAVLNIMNDDQLFSVPLTASLGVGERWSEKKDYDVG